MVRYGLSPLIRFTLISLYIALVLPLPLMAPDGMKPWMVLGVILGFVLVNGLLSEQVETDDDGINVRYPAWIRWLLRRGWSMRWEDIRAIVPVGTSQGGTVFYLKAADLNHRLLPQRIERGDQFLSTLNERSRITPRASDVSPALDLSGSRRSLRLDGQWGAIDGFGDPTRWVHLSSV